MRIRDLILRENYDETLHTNLVKALTSRSQAVDVVDNGVQHWFLHTLYDVYVPEGFCAAGRQWLAQLYGRSPNPVLSLPQLAICTASRFALFDRVFLRNAFDTTVDLGSNTMIMPGNRRFRRFDFATNQVWVTPKVGFDDAGIPNECAFRTRPDLPDFVPPCHPVDETAFVEPLIQGAPPMRLYSPVERLSAQIAAKNALISLQQIDRQTSSTRDYLQRLNTDIERAAAAAQNHFASLNLASLPKLMNWARTQLSTLDNLIVCRSHGDFQPSNVVVATDHQLFLIDWEETAIRSAAYDAMVWELNARAPKGLAQRLHAFMRDNALCPKTLRPLNISRAQCVAIWLLEDIVWRLTAEVRPPIQTIPAGLTTFLAEISTFADSV